MGQRSIATSEGRKIVYYDAGVGDAVVLLASWARPVSDFNELAEALHGAGYRTLAVESRGIGGSGGGGPFSEPTLADLAQDVEEVIDTGGIAAEARLHVVGHAFGNRLARSFASRYPARTRSVTLVAVPDAGHALLPEQPATIAGALVAFLGGF